METRAGFSKGLRSREEGSFSDWKMVLAQEPGISRL